ncbi:MBL fold metallo-hydrolase [Ktedonospora formicarum]|uniref:Metallo-beta-lactamase domain-containing protein n=1 Tax=Ktedonospora formicarum TaxID=2778364 RepID=A0A8J3MVG2_9CHLR|nr:MBL fold metallo-hydrolase [Ktedonospora formicarum]GHO49300.1 hypothetical protein KSX_74630 [Ktedonospora formicarum]
MSRHQKRANKNAVQYIHRVVKSAGSGGAGDLTEGKIFFVGTATVIMQYAGFTIMTDPNFLHKGDSVHLGYGIHSKRLTNPALELEEVPKVDFVLLSHLHEDHFDRIVMRKLARTTPIVTTPEAAATLKKKGFKTVYPLKTWESFILERGAVQLKVTAMPGKHARGRLAGLLPPVMGSMLEFQQVATEETLMRLYISGDTIYMHDLTAIPLRYPDIDLGLFHLGGTRIMGLLVTMDAKQGLKAFQLINPRIGIPIHYNDYTAFKSPLKDFQHAVEKAKLTSRMHYLAHGDTYTFTVPSERLAAVYAPAQTHEKK